jgi:hypothetical protein
MRGGALAAVALLAAATASAWEPDTTHAGLTEQAALASGLHARLVALYGVRGGWLGPLAIPPEHAPGLYAKLAAVEPTSGVVPDRRGRQSALAWLTAGAVVEGMPAERNRNHLWDAAGKRGPAPDWLIAKDNELSLLRFWSDLERAVTAPTPAEREEHLATALLAAGAMLHVLEDMGVPARVRADDDEFDLPLGAGLGDKGSRFERLATLLDGRLGVPEALPAIKHKHARDFYVGLAEWTATHFYSSGTLPSRIQLPLHPGPLLPLVLAAQRLPLPRPGRELDLQGGRGVARDAAGVCLADYAAEDGWLRFSISDDCAASQLATILPEVGGYAVGLLGWLFRGSLVVAPQDGSILVTVAQGELQLGAGQVTVLGEDKAGRREVIGTAAWSSNVTIPSRPGFVRMYAVFKGTDEDGEAVVAVGSGAP